MSRILSARISQKILWIFVFENTNVNPKDSPKAAIDASQNAIIPSFIDKNANASPPPQIPAAITSNAIDINAPTAEPTSAA